MKNVLQVKNNLKIKTIRSKFNSIRLKAQFGFFFFFVPFENGE